jgi:putative addiction module component (TIGR02574 family)
MDYQAVLDEVESWPVGERARLAQEIWDRLAADQEGRGDLSDEMKAELDRRVEELDRDPGSGVPWEEARDRVLGRLRK